MLVLAVVPPQAQVGVCCQARPKDTQGLVCLCTTPAATTDVVNLQRVFYNEGNKHPEAQVVKDNVGAAWVQD